MNTTVHIYVPEKYIQFVLWAQTRFKRNFSKIVMESLYESLEFEWKEHLKKLNGGQQDSAE